MRNAKKKKKKKKTEKQTYDVLCDEYQETSVKARAKVALMQPLALNCKKCIASVSFQPYAKKKSFQYYMFY